MAQRRVRDRTAPSAPTSTRRPWWLIAVGVVAALAFVLATLPAGILQGQLSGAGLSAAELSGTVWRGRARGLSLRSVPLGDLRWSVEPLRLLRGRVGGTVSLRRPDGTVSADVTVSLGGTLRLREVRADLPVEAVSALPLGMPAGWRGQVSADFESIVVESGWPHSLQGTVDMDGLLAPPPRNVSIGSFHIAIPDPQSTATGDGPLTARVTDKDGPFSFEGRFTLERDRSFLLEGTLAPRGSTPPALARSLELLGPADSAGRRPLSVSGTL